MLQFCVQRDYMSEKMLKGYLLWNLTAPYHWMFCALPQFLHILAHFWVSLLKWYDIGSYLENAEVGTELNCYLGE